QGRELTDHRAVSDLEGRALALEPEVLGIGAQYGAVRDLAILAQDRVPLERHPGSDLGSFPDPHARTDDGPGSDDDPFAEFCLRIYDGGGVDAGLPTGTDSRIAHLSTILAMNSASATTWPSTNPSPFILQVCLRYWRISSSKT